MKIAIASILQESNTFSPVYTRYEDFSPVYGQAAFDRHNGKLTEMGGFIDVLSKAGGKGKARVEIAPVCAAWAITANRLVEPDFTQLCERFRDNLTAVKARALLFAMHGAQTAEGEDDVEGRLLAIAREVLGPDKPIIVTLDLHANLTQRMVSLATAIVGYHTYPHIDMFETGQKAARLMLRTLSGEVKPEMAMVKLPLIIIPENSQTYRGPMHRILRRGKALESKGKAEAVSLFPVQPWLDIDEMGTSTVVVTNGRAKAAKRYATKLAQLLWDRRRQFDFELTPPEEAIAQALAEEGGPVVLSESADSTGSGSPGDSSGLLKYLVRAELTGPAAIFLVDPPAVAKAFEAGVGATVKMKIGGAHDKQNSKPVPVKAYVKTLSDGRWTARARGHNTGIVTSMGRSAVLEIGQVLVLAAEKSSMTVDPELFRSHGIDPTWCKIVAVKSPNGFRAAYEPIARKSIMVDTPGVSTSNLKRLPWKRIRRPIDPLDDMVDLPPDGVS